MIVIAQRNIAPSSGALVRVRVAPSNRPLASRPHDPLLIVKREGPRHPAWRPGTIRRAPSVAPARPRAYFADNKGQIPSLRSFDSRKYLNNYDLGDLRSRGVGAMSPLPSVGPERHMHLRQSPLKLRWYLLHKTGEIRSLRSLDCRKLTKYNSVHGNWRRAVSARHHPLHGGPAQGDSVNSVSVAAQRT